MIFLLALCSPSALAQEVTGVSIGGADEAQVELVPPDAPRIRALPQAETSAPPPEQNLMPRPKAKPAKPKPVDAKTAEQVELFNTKGLIEFNAGKYIQAEQYFRQAYQLDQLNYIAVEYLSRCAQGKNDLNEAIRLMQRARKIEPSERVPLIDYYIADLYMKQGRDAAAEEYFLRALESGAFPAATNYYLGYVLYRQEYWREAEAYFFEAQKLLAKEKKDGPYAALKQPIHYFLGEIYARTGFSRYSLYHLYAGGKGDVPQLKKAAWTLEEALDQPTRRITGGFFFQYDSNVVSKANEQRNPTGISNEKGTALVGLIDFAWTSSPSRAWGYGVEYVMYGTRHTLDQHGGFDMFSNAPSAHISWWNSKNSEVKLRYDYSLALLDRHNWKRYVQSQGPTIAWSSFPDRRKQFDGSYTYKRNYYFQDLQTGNDQLTGSQHTVVLRYGVSAPNPSFQPYGQYTFDYNDTDGRNYRALTNTLEAGATYLLGESYRVTASLGFGIANYGEYVDKDGKRDRILQVRTVFSGPITGLLTGFIDLSYLDNSSNIASLSSYRRFTGNLGLMYTLPL